MMQEERKELRKRLVEVVDDLPSNYIEILELTYPHLVDSQAKRYQVTQTKALRSVKNLEVIEALRTIAVSFKNYIEYLKENATGVDLRPPYPIN